MTIPAFLGSLAIGAKEIWAGYYSYKVYVKQNPKTGKYGIAKTIYYKNTNFTGDTKIEYTEW